MAHTLVLRLPPPGETDAHWLTFDESWAPTGSMQRGPLELAAAVSRSARVVVLAPSSQILLAEPELPPGTGVRLARAVPFALEEQLTEDIDQLIFAIGRRRANGATPVAVVSRTVMEGWMAQLSAAGIAPYAMYTDMALLPDNPGQTVIWLEGARLAARRPGMLPFAVELTPVTDALTVAGIIPDPLQSPLDAALEPKPLENVLLYVTSEDWEAVSDEFDQLTRSFESFKVQLLPDGPLPWLGRSAQGTDAVNLLQGEFARATDYTARWRQWRTAAVLAASLLVTHVGAEALQIHRANRDTAMLDNDIVAIFNQTLPGEAMTDPRRQMQSRLERIRHSGPSPEYFLNTLQVLGGAIASMPKTSIDAVSYHEQALDMKITAPSVASLSQITQFVSHQGMTADIQSSTPVGDGVEAHMQVHGEKSKAHP